MFYRQSYGSLRKVVNFESGKAFVRAGTWDVLGDEA